MKLYFQPVAHALLAFVPLALAAGALHPPGPAAVLAAVKHTSPTAQPNNNQIYLPLAMNGVAPSLVFTPNAVELAPGQKASVHVRAEPKADINAATFALPGVQDGVTSHFEPAPDGKSGR